MRTLKKKIVLRKSKALKKVPAIPRLMRSTDHQISTINCKVFSGTLSGSSVANIYLSKFFSLADCPDTNNYATIYDQYRLIKITLYVDYIQPALPSTAPQYSAFYSAVDYDDATTPTSALTVPNFATSFLHQPGMITTRSFRPKAAAAMQDVSGISSSAQAQDFQWMNTSYNDVKYYALKFFLSQSTTTNVPIIGLHYMYTWQFRKTR